MVKNYPNFGSLWNNIINTKTDTFTVAVRSVCGTLCTAHNRYNHTNKAVHMTCVVFILPSIHHSRPLQLYLFTPSPFDTRTSTYVTELPALMTECLLELHELWSPNVYIRHNKGRSAVSQRARHVVETTCSACQHADGEPDFWEPLQRVTEFKGLNSPHTYCLTDISPQLELWSAN